MPTYTTHAVWVGDDGYGYQETFDEVGADSPILWAFTRHLWARQAELHQRCDPLVISACGGECGACLVMKLVKSR
jgi:hypothetical protein